MNAQIISEHSIPQTDSIEELAKFWDSHEVTDFENELEEVTMPVFSRVPGTTLQVELTAKEFNALKMIAQEQHSDYTRLLKEWVLEKLYYAEMMRRASKEFQMR